MRLQLDSTGIQGAGSTHAAEVSSTTASRSSGSSSKGGTDSVGLSGTSRALQTAQTLHSERLARLGQAVRSGTYSVSAQAVSHAIIGQSGPSATGALDSGR